MRDGEMGMICHVMGQVVATQVSYQNLKKSFTN